MFQSELTIKVIRSGKDIHTERTLKSVAAKLEWLKLKEHVPTALESYLNQFPGLKQINMKALTSCVRDMFPKKEQSKVSSVVREWLSEHTDMFALDGSMVKVIGNQ